MEPPLVRDIMVTSVVALRPDDTIRRAVRVLLDHDLGGVPVVDDSGHLLGLLADDDLLVREGSVHVPSVLSLFLERSTSFPPPSVRLFDMELRKAFGVTVGEVMDGDPATCNEDETVETVATRMHDGRHRRLPVVRDGKLVGIVARRDLLRLLERHLGNGQAS